MLRHLYRCALRLHPAEFRRRFGEEMLSIYDHSAGRLGSFRLVLDGIASLCRQWMLKLESWLQASRSSVQHPVPDGIPSFSSLDPFRPRTSAMIHGMVISITLFCVSCFAIRYSWIHVLQIHIPEVQFEPPQWVPSSSRISASANQLSNSSIRKQSPPASTSPHSMQPQKQVPAATPTERADGLRALTGNGALKHSKPAETTPGVATLPNPAPEAEEHSVSAEVPLDAVERRRVIDETIISLRRYYIDPTMARKMAESLKRHEQNGDDDTSTDGNAFADLLTTQLRAVSHDRHLGVSYSQSAIPEGVAGPTQEAITRYRQEMERSNCTFEKIELLPHNIGYVKLNSFPDLQLCRSTAEAAMTSLNQASAIIFDLRDNQGGSPEMVAFMASYLFDHPTHLEDLYNRSENSTLQSWTLSPIESNQLADKPAFVLTSAKTFSGGEEFAYDLKMLKRATVVGETTAGAAHMVCQRRIDAHFRIRVPDTRPINPVSKTIWEGKGVTPDVSVKAADALKTAESLAQKSVQK